jgi:hypothetical protein
MLKLLVDRVELLLPANEAVDVRCLCYAELDCERLDKPVGSNCKRSITTACAFVPAIPRLYTYVHPALCILSPTNDLTCSASYYPQVTRHRLVPAVCL